MYLGRATRAEVDLSAIRQNMLNIKALLAPGVRFCAVVKGDGYGHGAPEVAREAAQAGADYLAVAILEEALALRAAGLDLPILVLGHTPTYQYDKLAAHGISQTLFSLEQAEALSVAGLAAGRRVTAHLKIETGMGRLGVRATDAPELAARLAALPGLHLEGVFTHFAKADSCDKSYALEQFTVFGAALEGIRARGVHIAIRHCANSAAMLDLPRTHLDMVRTGIIMYGIRPSEETSQPFKLLPAMRVKTVIAQLKTLPAGHCVSYGGLYTTAKEERIGTLPVGYADGWTRLLSGRAEVLVRGRRAPVVGRICMDQCMINLDGVPEAKAGDEVILFGSPDLRAEEQAARIGTIGYELVCMVSRRVPRVYLV